MEEALYMGSRAGVCAVALCAVILSSCCSCPPPPADFTGPESTVRTFLDALDREDPKTILFSLSSSFKKNHGLTLPDTIDIVLRVLRERFPEIDYLPGGTIVSVERSPTNPENWIVRVRAGVLWITEDVLFELERESFVEVSIRDMHEPYGTPIGGNRDVVELIRLVEEEDGILGIELDFTNESLARKFLQDIPPDVISVLFINKWKIKDIVMPPVEA